MKIYKFRDRVDGRVAFVAAKSQDEAAKALDNTTSIPFDCVGVKTPDELKRPIILVNNILPF